MKKLFLAVLIFGFLAVAVPTSAKISESNFLAAISQLVQEMMPQEEIFSQTEEPIDEDFIDPREVQQVLREIKDMRRELTRLSKQLAKMTNSGEDVNQINSLLGQIKDFETKILAEENLRDAIQEFRDAQIWQEIQKIRAKIEIPNEMKQWNKEIKRIEKLLKQKKIQGLALDFGLDLGNAAAKLEETKAGLARTQELYNSGDLEGAMEEFDDLRQDFHPGEIMSVIQRMQEVTNRLKAIKNAEVREQVKQAFAEVIDSFNEGEYRIARELMDESWNDIMKMINQALLVGKKKGTSRQNFFKMTDKLEEQMRSKAEEKKVKMEEIREKREEVEQPPPVIETAPLPVQ